MAVKAMGFITVAYMDTNSKLVLGMTISEQNNVWTNIVMDDIDPAVTDLTLNNDIRAFIKAYATTNGVSFGLFDTARLLNPIGM